MQAPSSAAVDEQVDFLCSVLPAPPARVLDVGCGSGRATAALQERGYEVVGIDPDPEAVARAAELGVPSEVSDLAAYRDPHGFDAVVFAKSLHHIPQLPATMDQVCSLLTGARVLVLDEFAHDEADTPTAALFYGLRDVLVETGVAAVEHDHGHAQASGADPLQRWRVEHEHEPALHSAGAMLDQLRRRFEVSSLSRGPYLWVYLSEMIEDTPGVAA